MKELEQLLHELYPYLMKYFMSQVGCFLTSEELTQETLFRACKNYYSFKGNSSIKTWVFGIARFTLLEYYRKKKFKKPICEYPLDTPSPEEAFLIQENHKALTIALAELEETERQVVLLRSYGELDFASIGKLLDLTPTNCRVIYCRTKQKLKKLMEKEVLL